MSSTPEDTGLDTSSNPAPDSGTTPAPTTQGSTTPGPTTPGPTPPAPEPEKPSLLKKAAKGLASGAKSLASNVGNQLASNLGKPGEAKKDNKDKPEDLMKLVDSLADTVGNINKGINGFLGSAIQAGFDKIVAKVKGNQSNSNPDGPNDPNNTTTPTTPTTGGNTPTTPPAPQNTSPPAPQDSTTPAPQDSTTPAPQDSTAPAPQDSTTPAPQDSTTPTPQDTSAPTPIESSNPTLTQGDPQSNPTPPLSSLSSDTVSDPKEPIQSTSNDQFPQDSGQSKNQAPAPTETESLDSGPSGPPM